MRFIGKGKSRSRMMAAFVIGAAVLGGSVLAAAPANAASCSSLGTDWNRISGSCTGYPSFTINWTCWGDPWTHSTTFYTSPAVPGASFNFDACGPVGVTGVWVS